MSQETKAEFEGMIFEISTVLNVSKIMESIEYYPKNKRVPTETLKSDDLDFVISFYPKGILIAKDEYCSIFLSVTRQDLESKRKIEFIVDCGGKQRHLTEPRSKFRDSLMARLL